MAGRSIVVTGGSGGIGLAVATAFDRDGHAVVITGRRRDRLDAALQRLGPDARAVAFDAGDPTAVEAALPDLPERVDVLVNSAGGNTDFDRTPPEPGDLAALAAAWRANLDANLLSAVLVTAALESRLPDGARIVTIGSIAARQAAGGYGAAKAAVEAWTADAADRLGPRGITANVVSPGLTEPTDFFRGRLTAQRRETLIGNTKTKRAGTTDDVAAVVAFLAAPEAIHVTGQVVHVNGGAYLGR